MMLKKGYSLENILWILSKALFLSLNSSEGTMLMLC